MNHIERRDAEMPYISNKEVFDQKKKARVLTNMALV